MKKMIPIILAFSIVFFLTARTAPSKPKPQEDLADLWIETNAETIIPDMHLLWSETYDGSGAKIRTEAEPVSMDDQSFIDSLPRIPYTEDFEIFLGENVIDYSYDVYNMDQSLVLFSNAFPIMQRLPEGEYIVEISIEIQGDYVEAADEYETSGYECWFCLTVPA